MIEKHLKQICQNHKIALTKKKVTISDLNQALKDKEVVSVPQWRFIQHLADIRNLCDHAKDKEPTKDDIEALLTGTDKILKTVF